MSIIFMIFSFGHSNILLEVFFDYLLYHNINIMYDVRGVPFSAYVPQFNQPSLASESKKKYIVYNHIPILSGKNTQENPNLNKEMHSALENIIRQSKDSRSLIMGANLDYNKCHRYSLCEHIYRIWNEDVLHILKDKTTIKHSQLQMQLNLLV